MLKKYADMSELVISKIEEMSDLKQNILRTFEIDNKIKVKFWNYPDKKLFKSSTKYPIKIHKDVIVYIKDIDAVIFVIRLNKKLYYMCYPKKDKYWRFFKSKRYFDGDSYFVLNSKATVVKINVKG